MFRHEELDLILVVYVDDFKMAGPTGNLAKGWESIKSVVDLGEPEPFDRYFGCHHIEKNNIKLPKSAHPFAHVFDPQQPLVDSSIVHKTIGSTIHWQRLGRGIISNLERSSTIQVMRGANLPSHFVP